MTNSCEVGGAGRGGAGRGPPAGSLLTVVWVRGSEEQGDADGAGDTLARDTQNAPNIGCSCVVAVAVWSLFLGEQRMLNFKDRSKQTCLVSGPEK